MGPVEQSCRAHGNASHTRRCLISFGRALDSQPGAARACASTRHQCCARQARQDLTGGQSRSSEGTQLWEGGKPDVGISTNPARGRELGIVGEGSQAFGAVEPGVWARCIARMDRTRRKAGSEFATPMIATCRHASCGRTTLACDVFPDPLSLDGKTAHHRGREIDSSKVDETSGSGTATRGVGPRARRAYDGETHVALRLDPISIGPLFATQFFGRPAPANLHQGPPPALPWRPGSC